MRRAAIQNMAINHFLEDAMCDMPAATRQKLLDLRNNSTSRYVGSGKEYWARSAKLLGIHEDERRGVLVLDRNKDDNTV